MENKTFFSSNNLDLKNFERQEMICKKKCWKYHVLLNQINRQKFVSKTSLYDFNDFSREDIIDFSQEIKIISQLDHPSIIKYIGFSPIDFKSKSKPVIITDYATHKSLKDILYPKKAEKNYQMPLYFLYTINCPLNFLLSNFNKPDEQEKTEKNTLLLDDTKKLIIIYGIASSLFYLHSHNIVHCNLRPSKILIDEKFYPKLTGFNNAKEISENKPLILSKFKGKNIYCSPEIFSNFEYSKSSDVYAFAMIVYEIVMNKKPFENIKFDSETLKQGIRPKFDESIPKCYRNLIEKCWSENPKERPNFDQILIELKENSEFITNLVDAKEYLNYIESIEETQPSFVSPKINQYFNELLISKTHTFHQSDIDTKSRCSLDSDLIIDLDNFELNYGYQSKYFYDLHTVVDKRTKVKYYAKLFKNEINHFLRYEINSFVHEINITSQLNHPSILKFIGYSPVDFNNQPKPVLLFEYYSNEDLNFLSDKKKNLTLDNTKILMIIYGIASGMAYLHSNNIIHHDLKLSNIHFDENLLPKISEFRISRENVFNKKKFEQIQGTPAYLPPETYFKNEYGKSSDVYSFALLVYELITKNQPYQDFLNPKEIKNDLSKFKRPKFINPIPKAYKNLIERCWSENENDRPNFDEIVNELKTNPAFLNDLIDKENFFEYVEFLDGFKTSFDPSKRIKQLDNILTTKLHTFKNIDFNFGLQSIYDTEINDLSLKYNFINLDNYLESSLIHYGSFYMVAKIIDKRTNEVFVKKVPHRAFNKVYQHDIINFSRELNILLQLNHPSILKLIGYSKPGCEATILPIMITEYVKNGSLTNMIELERKNEKNSEWNETKKLICIYGIASGMAYLHSNDIIHHDLKISNILLDDHLHPKIAGFNISRKIQLINGQQEEIKGTAAYLPPETYSNNIYNKSSDVYSFSLLVYEMLTNDRPYQAFLSPKNIKDKLLKEFQRPQFFKQVPKAYKDLTERCWKFNSDDRPTFNEIVNELKNNPEFITDKINKEEYYEYIKFIDESPITFESSNSIKGIDEYIQLKSQMFEVNKNKFNFTNIYETETEKISLDLGYIDIQKYEKRKLIYHDQNYKLYEFVHKETGILYFAKKIINDRKDIYLKELNHYLKIKHPSFLKFIGFSPFDLKNKTIPVIIQEYAMNNSLNKIIEIEKKNPILNQTKKLKIIYGIASGMSYLHSNNIIHCNLNPMNIYLDEFLHPKITGLDQTMDSSLNPIKELKEVEPRQIYGNKESFYSPELFLFCHHSSASDVYAFAMIIYELITNEKPFSDLPINEIVDLVCYHKYRPEFKQQIPECYKQLIERCWAHNPVERPTFDEIIYHLKTNFDFLTDDVDKDEFLEYVHYFDDFNNKTSQIDDFIKTKSTTFRKVKFDFSNMKELSKIHFTLDFGSIELNNYEKQMKIGAGGFGVVYKVTNKETDETYAAKISIYEMDDCSEDTIMNLKREIEIISQLDHFSILKYVGYSPINFKNKQKPVIITEYASNGSLYDILEMERMNLGNHQWDDTKRLINIYGISSAMKYLHNHNILHRDLKPANILLDDNLYPKIADFGLSKVINENDTKYNKMVVPSGFKGIYAYCAPEILNNKEYTKYGDVYAFAMIVYEIMTNEKLFDGLNLYQLLSNVSKGKRPEFKTQIPFCYQKLIKKCWSESPYKRPSFDKIVETLENDPSFITPNVDKDEFFDYVSYIKETQKINIIKSKKANITNNIKNSFEKRELKSNSSDLKIVEETNIINDNFLDLSKFERGEIISKSDFFKLYKFIDKETGIVYQGQISMIPIKTIENEEIKTFSDEIKMIKQMNHHSLLKFVGFSPVDFKNQPKPVIVTEMTSNRTLSDILKIERMSKLIQGWNETKKLINIFGIASGMQYLHSHNIIHRSLKTTNIYLDDILSPKIGDFGLSTRFNNLESMTQQSVSEFKRTPVNSAPEVLQNNEYSKSSDVYAFTFIVYEIITNEIPFNDLININQIFNEVVINQTRPMFNKNIPMIYQKLIEKCWSQNPNDRPSFDEIVHQLKYNNEFIIKNKVNENDYFKYINYVEEKITTNLPQKIKETDF